MEIKKKNNTFNVYQAELSHGELEALYGALRDNHAGVILDEIFKSLQYHIEKLPEPGEEEDKGGDNENVESAEDLDRQLPPPPGEEDEGGEGGEQAPELEDFDLNPESGSESTSDLDELKTPEE